MRVTANTYTNLVVSSAQSAQQQLAVIQTQISSGNNIQNPSDNPTVYSQAAQDQTSLAKLNAYAQVAATATSMTATNNQAMTSLHQIVAQAGEYLASVTSNMSPTDLKNLGTEMQGLVSQLTSIVNQKSPDGSYLFGGTSNQPPITSAGTSNTATNGSTSTVDVQDSNPVQVSIAAGNAGPPAVDGFLYDSASGTDVLAALTQAVTDLNSGNTGAIQTTDVAAVNLALNHVSSYVGSTAASMAAVSSANTQLAAQQNSTGNTINGLVQTDLASASVQLQQLEMQYQASLEAGTRVMNLSILNYMSSVSSS